MEYLAWIMAMLQMDKVEKELNHVFASSSHYLGANRA